MAHASIIKFEGPNDVFIWKHPIEDFSVGTQLIVHANQEAIFFKDGQMLDTFGAGSHTLNTDNLPLLKKIIGKLFGGKTPFHAQVYFVNKVVSMNLRWGTFDPIPMEDTKYGIFVNVRANGQMGVRIADARKAIMKLTGQIHEFNQMVLGDYFRGAVISKVRDNIAKFMVMRGISFLEVTAYTTELSKAILEDIKADFEEYGIEVVNFYTNSVSVPDEDYLKLKNAKENAAIMRTQADAESYKTIKEGEALAQSRKLQGYTYQDERMYDVLNSAASNEGNGNMMNVGMGLGMGVGMGNPMGMMFGNMMNNGMMNNGMMNQPYAQQPYQAQNMQQQNAGQVTRFCTECGTKFGEFNFCPNCGTKYNPPALNTCSCGAILASGTKFCGVCGKKVGE